MLFCQIYFQRYLENTQAKRRIRIWWSLSN